MNALEIMAPLICDRASAREARNAVNKELLPLAASLGATLSLDCPLHPEHDHLLLHEGNKTMITQFQWKCSICGKLFRSEHYLDRHFDRRHLDTLSAGASTCLGDFCDVLRCPSWLEGLRRERKELAKRNCRPAELDARRHFCQHMMHDCFTAHNADMHPVFETMDEHYCKPLSCAGQQSLREGHSQRAHTVHAFSYVHAFGALIDSCTACAAGHKVARPVAGGNSQATYYVLSTLLLAALVALYVGIACWCVRVEVRVDGTGLNWTGLDRT